MARILVVDDSAQNLALIEHYLRGTEFEVATATGGHEALDLCMQQGFELILLDVVMPGLDGLEVCRRLKNDPRTAFVPVIFLTGHLVDESDKVAAYQLGAVDYLSKPVNREELVARIRVMLRLEGARSRLERENIALRRQVDEVEQGLHATTRLLDDLQRLRAEFARGRIAAVLMLDPKLRVVSADAESQALLGRIVAGEVLAAQGHVHARLQRLVEHGARSADLTMPAEGGGSKTIEVAVNDLGDGCRLVLLRDVTGVRLAEGGLRDREVLAPAPPAALSRRAPRTYSMTGFVGCAASVEDLADHVSRLRQGRSTVLIYGESGTGKELVARALHFDGRNRSAPFIPLHCGAIAPELVESELFGHEKGAFTGAQQSRDGLFRAADGGTIFLDEIAEMSLDLQVKLLRVLQRGEIRPVGANQPRIIDVRILAATNQDLLQLVREGRFREDLYYRLEVVTLHLPSLRERVSDLPLLVDHFIQACNLRHDRRHRPVRGVSQAAMARILAYPWPGNVRELENAIERAFALGVGDVLQEEDLSEQVVSGQPSLVPKPVLRPARPAAVEPPHRAGSAPTDLRALRQAAERQAILQSLRDHGGDKIAAAHHLGMSRSTFYRRVKELEV